MKRIAFTLLICMAATYSFAQVSQNEKTVMAFYSGFEHHNWNTVAAQFAPDFTFSSAAGDDHIPIKVFHERCWPTNKSFKSVRFLKWADGGDKLFLMVEMTTTDHKLIRNVDVYTFKGGKMASMDCYFGTGGGYPGNGKK
ncbi:MAG TPA: nuclear transport factor 2 family protein [Mucilaginibacter sp.]|nr:nuclear transport factor 2 family protein [Mucilaginibacter sp.]